MSKWIKGAPTKTGWYWVKVNHFKYGEQSQVIYVEEDEMGNKPPELYSIYHDLFYIISEPDQNTIIAHAPIEEPEE